MMQAVGSSLVRAKRALVDRPIVIAAAVCDGQFHEDFAPYPAAFELLQSCQHPADMVQHQEALATDPEWVRRYRDEHAYHPFHAFSMIYVGGIARDQTSAVYVAGAKRPTSPARWAPAPRPPSRRRSARPPPPWVVRRRCSPSPPSRAAAFHLATVGGPHGLSGRSTGGAT